MDETILRRVLPNSIEAEQSVLGSMLMNRDVISEVADLLKKEDFYQAQYGVIYDAIIQLYNEGKPVDLVTLKERLVEMGVPDTVYSMENLAEILGRVPTSANAKQYANIVQERAILRCLIKATDEISNDCYTMSEPLDGILEKTEQEIYKIVQGKNGMADFQPIEEVVVDVLNTMEENARNKTRITGVPTGFIDLDMKLTGLHSGELILIAARPAMGKTAFALNIAQHVIDKKQMSVAIFSLEMSKQQLVTRMMAMDSMVDSQSIRTGDLADSDWDKIMESSDRIGSSMLYIDDTPGITVSELRSKCRKLKQTKGLDLIVIDYLQLMSGSRKTESRQQEVSEISRSLKALARELEVPIIALSQLSRAVEARENKKPQLSDLRESGSIEQDADVVMFIYRDDYYNPDSEKKNIADIIVAKQRSGSTGSVELVWMGQYTKFANKLK